jgi:hypothetical protein
MGYRREPKIYKLVFADPDMEGLIVRAKSTSVRQFLEIQAMADATEASDGVKGMQTLFATFAGVLVSWNLEDENGQELPTTVDTLLEQEFGFVMQIVMAWIEAVAGVPDKLGKASTGGSPLLEASLPMEPLSISLAS